MHRSKYRNVDNFASNHQNPLSLDQKSNIVFCVSVTMLLCDFDFGAARNSQYLEKRIHLSAVVC